MNYQRHAALTGKSVQNANFYAKASIFFIVGTYIGLTGLAQCQCQTAQDTPLQYSTYASIVSEWV